MKKIAAILLGMTLVLSGCGGNGDSATNAALEDISVKTTPKTEYI